MLDKILALILMIFMFPTFIVLFFVVFDEAQELVTNVSIRRKYIFPYFEK